MMQAFGLLLVSILTNVTVQFFMKIARTKHGNVDVAIGYYFFKESVSFRPVGLGLIVCGVVLMTTAR